MSGQDILDQAAGTTPFVHDYLHISWDGTEVQNDKPTDAVHGVSGNPVSNGIGAVPLDHSVLNATFEDQITPNGGALTGVHRRQRAAGRADVRGLLQGRLPGLPARGLRDGGEQGRPRGAGVRVLRAVTPRRLSIVALLALGAWLVPGAVAQRPPNVIGTLARSAPAPAACPSERAVRPARDGRRAELQAQRPVRGEGPRATVLQAAARARSLRDLGRGRRPRRADGPRRLSRRPGRSPSCGRRPVCACPAAAWSHLAPHARLQHAEGEALVGPRIGRACDKRTTGVEPATFGLGSQRSAN